MISEELKEELKNYKGYSTELFILIDKILRKDNINLKDKEGWNILCYAVTYDFFDLAKLLLESGIDVNSQDKYGNTILIESALYNEIKFVKLLLQYGADIQIKDISGKTALDYAKQNENQEIIELLEQMNDKNNVDKLEDLEEEVKRLVRQ